jgi:hypothetical protein
VKLRHTLISLPADGIWLDGRLAHAPDVRGLALILLSDTWHPPEAGADEFEAVLQEHGLATMRLNLLTRQEGGRDPDARFNVARLSGRVLAAADWVAHQPPLAPLALGLVAGDTASAAAVRAATHAPARFGAIACLGGRPDLAGVQPLRGLRTPIRFVIEDGEAGTPLLHRAYALLEAAHDWVKLAPQAEGGALARARARAAAAWLLEHLATPGAHAADATTGR